uniref:Ca2+-activated K+ channel Slowpoke-like C-terminal domain-containing protein n=1 Tax=Romanomermis culicivorax TaxID=13658 RepID=A0A915KA37_ROMCU
HSLQTYFNESALTLIRTLVTGGATPELELILAEGAGLRGGYSTPELLQKRDRCRIAQHSLGNSGPLEGLVDASNSNATYGQLFSRALNEKGMLCFGLYRLQDDAPLNSNKRYVITSCPANLRLQPGDLVFLLEPFDPGLQYEPVQKRKNAEI